MLQAIWEHHWSVSVDPGAPGLTRSLVREDKVWLWPPPGLVLWWDITHLGGWFLTLLIENHWGEDLPIR